MKNLNIIIEIPKGSNIKYEYNRKKNKIIVDRILRKGFSYPANYGFIAETLDWDGDELDVLVYSNVIFQAGIEVNVRIVGAMKMIDDGETDTKLIAIHNDDYRLKNIVTLDDIPKKWIKKIKIFFSKYKNWKYKGITSVLGFEKEKWAQSEYEECKKLMNIYGNMNKKEFIKKMKIKHPEKYK